jgi:hypothetical protein
VIAYTPGADGKLQVADQVATLYDEDKLDVRAAAQDLARSYRFEVLEVLRALRTLYPAGELPIAHYDDLARQIEAQTSQYEIAEETVEDALALVRKDGFDRTTDAEGNEAYTAEISYPIDREELLTHFAEWQARAGSFGFHYSPYNFDSRPEKNYFENMLELLRQKPEDVEDIYFTGALTDPNKTEFLVEYRGVDGRTHSYSPDFVIRRKDGRCLIVEVKRENERGHAVDGEKGAKAMAMRKWEGLNPGRLRYQMVFVQDQVIAPSDVLKAKEFLDEA